jgi:hypothetical protein
MAMTTVELEKLQEVEVKLAELRGVIEGSLSIRAVGGVYVANEIIKIQPKVKELLTAIQTDIDEHEAATEPTV